MNIKPGNNKAMTHYNLKRGIIHRGGSYSGHYTNIAKISNRWYEIDDVIVTKISEACAIQRLENNGVLVMYQHEQASHEQNTLRESKDEKTKDTSSAEKKPRVEQRIDKEHSIENKHIPPNNRKYHFFRPSNNRRKYWSSKRVQWTKVYLEKSRQYYYDADKKCFYTPRV